MYVSELDRLNRIKELLNEETCKELINLSKLNVDEYKSIDNLKVLIDVLKDYASSALARELDADILLILTAVDKVYLNYKKDNEIGLDEIHTKEIDTYIKDRQFAEGSMLPKILACVDFVNNSDNKLAIITSLDKALEALKGKTGTRIKK